MYNALTIGISSLVSVIICCINNRNTGKKLEEYKRNMVSEKESFDIALKLYKELNNIIIKIKLDKLGNSYYGQDEYLRTKLRYNKIFLPKTIYEKMVAILDLFNKYTECWNQVNRQGIRKKTDEADENLENVKSKVLEHQDELESQMKHNYDIFQGK